MEVINVALETALGSKDKEEWTPVTVNVASATLTILKSEVRVASLPSPDQALYHPSSVITRSVTHADGGSSSRVSRAFPVIYGSWEGRAHVCVHHGRGVRRLHLSHVLVRSQRGRSERGCAGRLYGERTNTQFRHNSISYLHLLL